MSNKKQTTKGYKVTNSNMQCRGFQFEIGKIFKQSGKLIICENGFHFCEVAADCFNYYNFDTSNRVFEVEAYGKLDTEGDKHCSSEIKFIREVSWLEVLEIVNTGKGNTGISNSGNYNSGNRNSGNYNSGNRNSGNRNSGNRNAGNYNAGNDNSGNYNSGNRNSGNYNSGYSNAGNDNSGNYNSGNYNSGNRNSGNSNAGNRNSGNSNAGNYNSGNRNAGYSNAGNDNAGAFNNLSSPNYVMFNKPSTWSYNDFINSDAYKYLSQIDTTLWIPDYKMTDEEKVTYPYYITTGGYVRNIPYKEAFSNSWNNWSEKAKQSFKDLPNFDADIFEDITGIRV